MRGALMISSTYEHTEALVISISSVILYGILLGASLHQLRVHHNLKENNNGGSFIEFKLVFFYVMAISALFSLPLWIGCLAIGTPSSCDWEGPSYYILWSLHLLALIGFSFCVGIPSIMWSDIINNTQRILPGTTVSFLFSFRHLWTVRLSGSGHDYHRHLEYPPPSSSTGLSQICGCCSGVSVNYIRLTFVIFVCSYAINELVVIASFIVYSLEHRNVSDFVDHSTLYRVSTYIEPVIILFFASNCLISGISLQLHVRRARLEESVQRKLLTTLNSVLLVVTITYITRAVCVLDLFLKFSGSLTYSYAVWIICTHWMPHLLGSSCLFFIMSQGSEKKPRGKVYKGEGGDGDGDKERYGEVLRRGSCGRGRDKERRIKGHDRDGVVAEGSRSASKSRSSKDKDIKASMFNINSSDSSSFLDGSASSREEESHLIPLLGEDDLCDQEDGDECGQSSEYGGECGDSEYDSFYDPYYDSQSEDGGGMFHLRRNSTFGAGGEGLYLMEGDEGLSSEEGETTGFGFFSGRRSTPSSHAAT